MCTCECFGFGVERSKQCLLANFTQIKNTKTVPLLLFFFRFRAIFLRYG